VVDWNACDSCVNGKRAEDVPKLMVRKREGCKRLENSFFAFVMNGEAMFLHAVADRLADFSKELTARVVFSVEGFGCNVH
jgi:hypothetical protein